MRKFLVIVAVNLGACVSTAAEGYPQQLIGPPKTFFSDNGAYCVRVETIDPQNQRKMRGPAEVELTMASVKGTEKIPIWTSRFKAWLMMVGEEGAIVANDGGWFAGISSGKITVYAKEGPKEIPGVFFDRDQRPIHGVLGAAGRANGRDLAGVWTRKKGWRAFDVASAMEVKPDAATSEKWDADTRERIAAKLEKARDTEMRDKLAAQVPGARKVIEKLGSAASNVAVSEAEYMFLIQLHDARDRIWFERLLEKQPNDLSTNVIRLRMQTGHWEADHYFSERDPQRANADMMLGLWEGRAKLPDGEYGFYSDRRYILAGVAGIVRLPSPVLTKAGTLRIFLVTQGTEAGAWLQRRETEMLEAPLPDVSPNDPDFANEIEFAFETVAPGKYFLKAIWDKRPPFDNVGKAGVGDYESNFFGPIELKSGMELTNLFVQCTNRSSDGATYYAADEKTQRLWKAGDLSPGGFGTASASGSERFSKPAEFWIVKTNKTMPREFGHLSRIAVAGRGTDPVGLRVYWIKRRGGREVSEVTVLDERGRILGREEAGYRGDCYFSEIPKTARFRLVGKMRDDDERVKVIFDYTMTNLALKAGAPK
jgi:hypothetical protein